MSTPQQDDPVAELYDRDSDSAEIIKDPINGYDRIVPKPEVLDGMITTYVAEVVKADADWQPVFAEMRAAEIAYAADIAADPNAVITIPVSKRIANQQADWQKNAILSKTPYITCKPIDGGSYQIPAEVTGEQPVPGAVGQDGQPDMTPQPLLRMEEIQAEEAAELYEAYLQYKLSECLNFEQLVEDTVNAIHQGENPTYWRVDYDPRIRYARTRKMIQSPRGVQFYGIEDTRVVPKDMVKFRHVSGYNITMPITATDEQEAWWVGEKTPVSNVDLWEGIKNGRYDLCRPAGKDAVLPEDTLRGLFGFAEDLSIGEDARRSAEIDRHVASDARREHDIRTLWFYHPFRTERGIEIRSCIGELHVKARLFLNMYVNWSWTSERLIIPFFRHRRPHRFSGMSAAGDVAPIQRLLSSAFNLQIQNGVGLNVKVFLIRENSATWRWFEKNGNKVRPGSKIPYEDKDDINPIQLSAPIETMAPHITFLDNQAERLMVNSDFTSGVEVPNRTAAATVSLQDQKAAVQPSAGLRPIRRSIGKAIEMYMQTVAQFKDYEVIPFLDPEKKRLIAKLIGFPRETIANHFSFHVTATGDEDTEQARFEKAGLLIDDTDKANTAAMGLMKVILEPNIGKADQEFAKFLLLRRERLFGEKIESFKLDPQHYVIDEKFLDALIAMPPPQPPPPPPPAPEPKEPPKISLTGQLTPDQIAAALQDAGISIGATNGQSNVPPPGPAGALQAPPSGPVGNVGPPGQPGGAGGVPANP